MPILTRFRCHWATWRTPDNPERICSGTRRLARKSKAGAVFFLGRPVDYNKP